jgi:hypothetical protein
MLFAKRIYLAVRRRGTNRYLGKLQRLRPPAAFQPRPA